MRASVCSLGGLGGRLCGGSSSDGCVGSGKRGGGLRMGWMEEIGGLRSGLGGSGRFESRGFGG